MKWMKQMAVAGVMLGVAGIGRAADVADPDPTRFEEQVQTYVNYDRHTTPPKNAVLFVGSSSIKLWPSADNFPDFTVLNRGFGGSQWSDLNHYFDQLVAPYDAPTIVLYEGDNDITVGKSPEQVLEDTREFLEKVKGLDRQPKLIFLAIKPSIARAEIWPQMERYNKLLEELCESLPNARYVDEADVFYQEDGSLPKDWFADGLHLSPKGYQVWVKALTPLLEELHPDSQE